MPAWTFVRHGQSTSNLEGWLAGHTDAPLTEQGEAQAIAARPAALTPVPDRAFCSDLSRAHRTAKLLLEGSGISLSVTPRLRERDAGAWQRRRLSTIEASGEMADRMGTWTGRPPGGESLLEVALRATGWLATVDDDVGNTLIVAHGALMQSVLAVVEDLPRDQIGLVRPKNCEVFRWELDRGTWAKFYERLRREAANAASAPVAGE